MMRKRGGSNDFRTLTINEKSSIGYKSSKMMNEFSFKKSRHVAICLLIIIITMSITVLSHWLLNDFDEIEHKQKQEITQIEDLFYDEHVWMQQSHERSVEQMEKTHQKDMNNELKWFLDEMNSITGQKQKIYQEHEAAEYKLNATARIHEYHSEEQKKLDEKLNAMYVDAGDKIEYVNKQMTECTTRSSELDAKLETLREKQTSDIHIKGKTVPEPYYKYEYKQDN